ncbi:hypothetical protein HFO02_12710 [Rhizobium laguerreae]|uniref:hypothetical protein n=1 Tax=Rhizobium laguerreae TaxID=1076926 RepID=UPI001C90F584|nr:hypothetical protein [Rhizobium laguerreae]MBY3324456.1 hypothetical protein [Rhizobium laguerreae]
MKNHLWIAMTCGLLSACQTVAPQSVADSQKPPSDALRSAIVQAARNVVFDPYSIRDAEISNVVFLNPQSGIEAVCVKANAKNQLGGYTGRQATGISIRNGTILGATQGDPRCLDPRLRYHRFKELENLKSI